MLYFREIVALLCLVLLAWSLLAPVAGPEIVSVLPVIGFLSIVIVSLPIHRNAESSLRVLDPSHSTIALRAPPQR